MSHQLIVVSIEISKRLSECSKKSDAMGISRSDEKSQRTYLGKIAAKFERIVGYALNAYYTEDQIFNDHLDMRLITRIIKLNEVFSEVFSQNGHTRHFEHSSKNEEHEKQSKSQFPEIGFDIPDAAVHDLYDIIRPERFQCPEPTDDSIMEHIDDIFQKSRGPELGTVGATVDSDEDNTLMLCRLAARFLAPFSKSNPGAGRISSSLTSVMPSLWCIILLSSCWLTPAPKNKSGHSCGTMSCWRSYKSLTNAACVMRASS